MEKIINLFEEWRQKENLTQKDAAAEIGISVGSYNNFVKKGKAGKIVKRQLLSYLKNNLNGGDYTNELEPNNLIDT